MLQVGPRAGLVSADSVTSSILAERITAALRILVMWLIHVSSGYPSLY
jgi:hypothetical protein